MFKQNDYVIVTTLK